VASIRTDGSLCWALAMVWNTLALIYLSNRERKPLLCESGVVQNTAESVLRYAFQSEPNVSTA